MSTSSSRLASIPKPVLESLHNAPEDAPAWKQVFQRAQWLDRVDQQLRPSLPPALATHARLANVQGECLVYLVDSPVWHTRLRLLAEEVLTAARRLGLDVSGLTVRIASQSWNFPLQQMVAIDAKQRRIAGTTSTEGRALREMRAVLGLEVEV